MRVPFGLFLLWNNIWNLYQAFWFPLNNSLNQSGQHVPTKLHLNSEPISVFILKVRQSRLFFAAVFRAEKNKAATRSNKSSGCLPGRVQLLPREESRASFPNTAALQRTQKMTSRSVPGNYTVQLTNTSGDCKFPTLAGPDTRQSVSMAISRH